MDSAYLEQSARERAIHSATSFFFHAFCSETETHVLCDICTFQLSYIIVMSCNE